MKKFVPHDYQRYCIERIEETSYIGLFLDMGLGKTVITLTALHNLKYYRWCINKTLVIAPKTVAEGTWTKEATKWEHLQGTRISVVLGSEKERIAALETPADIYVINRDNVIWLVKMYGFTWPFDTVVLDESSSFKNPAAKRFKALSAVRNRINHLIELTGTPSSNGLVDLWAQVYLLDQGKRLGRTKSVYLDTYFEPDKRNRTQIFSYKPRDDAENQIYQQISDICISMKAEDYLQLPDLIYDDIPVTLSGKAKQAYDDMARDMLLEVDEEEYITAANAATLTGKLLQLCNGAVYDQDKNIRVIHDCKIAALLDTVEQLCGQHAVIYYYYQHDRDRILSALTGKGLRVRVYRNTSDETDWNAGQIDILLAQPASCGYGLNLQDGGHHIIWFGLTWSLEEYLQANKRLHRQGQQYPVIIHRLITQGGMDEDVIRALESKDASQEELLAALKVRIRSIKEER